MLLIKFWGLCRSGHGDGGGYGGNGSRGDGSSGDGSSGDGSSGDSRFDLRFKARHSSWRSRKM